VCSVRCERGGWGGECGFSMSTQWGGNKNVKLLSNFYLPKNRKREKEKERSEYMCMCVHE
jgi:hypothetical protein